jgi:CubicO group peptidase (beta-lactamase class C family)
LTLAETTATLGIPRADRPEDVGVSGKAIVNFLRDIEQSGNEFHSFMVIRHGKVAAECFRAPFGPQRPHQMYSVSKSVTSAAVGFALSEGLLSLETKVRDLFPDYTEGLVDENLDQLTVHHLLSMSSGKNPSPLYNKSNGDWIEYYFRCPWYAKPGGFKYINENIYMLSVIVKRVTGHSVRDYLQPRLFEPLGIDYPFWETDGNGIESGGWGLYLKTEDLAKFMLCYANNGVFNGKQVIPEEWVKLATGYHADNSAGVELDTSAGYGYCFWHNGGCPGSYRADGMFSQFGIVFPEQDAVFISTGAVAVEQVARDLIWRHFPAAFLDENAEQTEDTSVPNLKEILASSPVEMPEPSAHCQTEQLVDGKTIKLRKTIFLNLIGMPVSVLPLAVTYMATEKAGNIDDITLKFGEHECAFSWCEGAEKNTVVCGMDGHYRYGTMRLGSIDYTVCCNAEWQNNNELMVYIRPIQAVAKRMLRFQFNANGRVTVVPRSTPKTLEITKFLVINISDIVNAKGAMKDILGKIVLKTLPKIVEPTLHGKIAQQHH